MEIDAPKQIKSYYIAYFDILGYKEFFHNNPDKVPDLLNMIHAGIQGTINKISSANNSALFSQVASINIEVRVFSDNVLLCMEELENSFDRVRILSFIMMVAEIQRGFITQCNLFIRGGIIKGLLSINPDYVFGKGLIDVVAMEESAVYPRIEISQDIISALYTVSLYTQDEGNQAARINERITKGEEVSDEERALYIRVGAAIQKEALFQRIVSGLVFQWPDRKWVLSYLYCFDINSIIPTQTIAMLLEKVKNEFPSDYKYFNANTVDVDNLLKQHKEIVEGQLKEFGHNDDIETGDNKAADLRERILKKYIWVMAYHNLVCEFYKKPNFKILTNCNCDTRFLKIIIDIIDNDAEGYTDSSQHGT